MQKRGSFCHGKINPVLALHKAQKSSCIGCNWVINGHIGYQSSVTVILSIITRHGEQYRD